MLTKYGTQWYAIIGTKKEHPLMRQTCELLDAWLMGGCNSLLYGSPFPYDWTEEKASASLLDAWLMEWDHNCGAAVEEKQRHSTGDCQAGLASDVWEISCVKPCVWEISCVKPKRHRSKQTQLGSCLGIIHWVRFPKWGKENMETTLFYFYLVCFSGSSLVLAIPQSSADPKVIHNLLN